MLRDLIGPNRWTHGPSFLLLSPESWPVYPVRSQGDDISELRKTVICGLASPAPNLPSTWKELLQVTMEELQGAANQSGYPLAKDYHDAKELILRRAQQECFSEELCFLKSVPSSSTLLTLSPKLDGTGELIHVGGRLHQSEDLELTTQHPVVLDPSHPVTRLLIQDYDSRLCHSGPERVFAVIRRSCWGMRPSVVISATVLTAIDGRLSLLYQRWQTSLRLFKPTFYSSGLDSFGPLKVKWGRCTEKRWGIIFKCSPQELYIWTC